MGPFKSNPSRGMGGGHQNIKQIGSISSIGPIGGRGGVHQKITLHRDYLLTLFLEGVFPPTPTPCAEKG